MNRLHLLPVRNTHEHKTPLLHSMCISIFTISHPGQIKAMFNIVYSDLGTIHRAREEQTFIYISDFFDECEGT